MTIEMSETGVFFVFNEAGFPVSGPYDTPEDAQAHYPDAEIVSPFVEFEFP